MSERKITYGREYHVRTREDGGYVLTLVQPKKETESGRTLLCTHDGVWECSREGNATPLVKIDGSSTLYERLVAGRD